MFNREQEWVDFAEKVRSHIVDYTIPQYGDAPDDSVQSWSYDDCLTSIKKYTARFGTNTREGQDLLDLMKIAHYACLAFNKHVENIKSTDEIYHINRKDFEYITSIFGVNSNAKRMIFEIED